MDVLFAISGVVKRGNNQGKALGYPTANIPLTKEIPEGIYASTVSLASETYTAVSFVGKARTFDRTDSNVESYIFDFDQDIYEKEITIHLYRFLRGNKKFDSVDALVDQMKEDVMEAKQFFAQKRR